MKELSIIVLVTPLGNMKKKSYTFISDPFSVSPSIETTAAGNLFNCDKDITIELPDRDTIKEFQSGRSAVVSFRDTTGRIINIGTQEMPATLSISPSLNSATLSIKCRMIHSPL